MRTGTARLLGSADRAEVEVLRFATLVNEGSFIARPEAVEWGESDERSRVLGIYSLEGVLLSALRAELLSHPEELPPKLDFDTLHESIALPCGLLGKATTRPEVQGQGLNSYLRYLAYEEFHALGVRHVVGTLMPNASRKKLLEALGYEFIVNPEGWRRYGYQSFGPTLVATLDLAKNYERVQSILRPKVARLIEAFPYAKGATDLAVRRAFA